MARGLAMYQSLVEHCQEPFTLWILCFDQESYDLLAERNLSQVRLISQQEFEHNDIALQSVKSDRTQVEYYWTCTPSLPLYILKHYQEVEIITYLDGDLYFFADPKPLYEELGGNSILIISHRYAPKRLHLSHTSGIYNVGWLSFRRDQQGLACLEWWRERCLEWCYARYEDGKFGDQLYLNDWPERFSSVVVSQHKGGNVAPWNIEIYKLSIVNDSIYVDEYPLLFFHFHAFRYINHFFASAASSRSYEFTIWQIKQLYVRYAKSLQLVVRQQNLPKMPNELPDIKNLKTLYVSRYQYPWFVINPTILTSILWRYMVYSYDNYQNARLGIEAYHSQEFIRAHKLLKNVVRRNPFYLFNSAILSILLEKYIGHQPMIWFRHKKKKWFK
jgi:hypothetical protein